MSRWRLLTADAELPEVAAVPPPWRLKGDGWILFLRLPAEARHDPRHIPAELADCEVGGPSVLMFVDYASSPAGPYRELLYIPGRFTLPGGRKAWSVSRIYVSTWDSVVNGRRNWGIPKDLAEFRRSNTGGGETLSVSVRQREVVRLRLAPRGPALPFSATLLPAAICRLVQFYGGRRFELVPRGRGRVRPARVLGVETDVALFPDLSAARTLATLQVPRFTLEFPVAETSPSRQER